MSGAPDDLPHKLRKFDWYRTAMLINPERASDADMVSLYYTGNLRIYPR
eukprot:SAG11_NODE_3185_length_2625_cov_1.849960_1_plen_49_part_00